MCFVDAVLILVQQAFYPALVFHEFAQFHVGGYGVYGQPDNVVQSAVFRVVCRGDMGGSFLLDELHAGLPGFLPGFRPHVGVVHRDGRSALVIDHFHGRDIRFPVTDIDHSRKRDGSLFFQYELVDGGVVPRVVYPLVDAKQELRFVRVVNSHGRPFGDSIHVVLVA